MKLVKVKIKNFRCYRNEMEVNFNDLTALIGKNDAGKSTILEALEIFFNNSTVVIDKDDLNKDSLAAGELKIEISCFFSELPSRIIIDAANHTSLQDEYLVNTEGLLEIKKVFPCTAAKPKGQVFIVANHPITSNASDLLQLKRNELRTRATDLGVVSDNYNANVNSSIRQAIWQHVENLNFALTDIPVDKEDSKKLWEALEKWLPVFALFQSDRKSREDDKEITDPMKVAINEALQEVSADLLLIQQRVHDKALEVANRTLQKLQEMNPALANELKPDFKAEPKWNSIFSLTLASDRDIPINKRGSGVRRLIVLNFFRAEAERRRQTVNNPSIIYAFEEPETSQHPDHQILLVQAFKELAEAPNTQILLTTHTPSLGGLIESENLRFVTKDEHGIAIVKEGENDVLQCIARTLGVLPDPLASTIKLMVCVEGPNDIAFLKNVSPIVREIDPSLPDLNNEPSVAIIPLGGGTLKDWVNNDYLKGLGLPEYHIYDRDDPSNPPYLAAAQAVIGRGGYHYAVLTNKRETENYIHHEAINRLLGTSIVPFTDTCDVPALVAEAIHSSSESPNPWSDVQSDTKKKKISQAKKRLNYDVTPQMTADEFQAADPGNEILGWFREIKLRIN
ncbi:putative ATP-dependent endonuclease of OLD family [Pontibacter aydingkolensis]|uniref:ATP-binding protein n=1 Tax=Pontibacter aydingkolensis TaxID=1911536 RepID=A0ABS7CVM3_9BACT|nr:ATP-binding protein [Pontibacter aydingkolensis]MBW7467833.1 ATP-binding protein [Pontibacter aydingkolensis]